MDISKIQEINFLLLKELRRVCEEYSINYFIDSGTLIGAVRDKDFIPWDDDADVVFLREDFEKLRALPSSVWGPQYRFVNYDDFGENVFFDTLAHLFFVDANTSLERNPLKKVEIVVDKTLNNKVCMDIFVLDPTYGLNFFHYIKVAKCYLLHCLMMGYRPNIEYSTYTITIRFLIYLLSHFGRLFKLSTLMSHYEKICIKGSDSPYCFYSNITLWKARKKILRKEWWTDGICKLNFHGELFNAPKRYHDILTYEYGDYMTPPCDQKDRHPEHFLI